MSPTHRSRVPIQSLRIETPVSRCALRIVWLGSHRSHQDSAAIRNKLLKLAWCGIPYALTLSGIRVARVQFTSHILEMLDIITAIKGMGRSNFSPNIILSCMK